MTKVQAEFIKLAMGACEEECNVREGYSGRGMYGKRTWAVVVPSVLTVLGAVTNWFIHEDTDGYQIPQLDDLSVDHMGRDSVVIY